VVHDQFESSKPLCRSGDKHAGSTGVDEIKAGKVEVDSGPWMGCRAVFDHGIHDRLEEVPGGDVDLAVHRHDAVGAARL
jgi:hypothetical protein